jgi:8-oxo-dGTP diphosphatase
LATRQILVLKSPGSKPGGSTKKSEFAHSFFSKLTLTLIVCPPAGCPLMVKTTVGAIITREENGQIKILLTRRNIDPYKGEWCLPGGHINLKENAKDAVIREVREETGLDFDCNFFNYFDEIIPEKNIHATVLIFTGTASGNILAQESEVAEIKWFNMPDIFSLDLAFYHSDIIKSYLKESSITDR